MFMRSVLELLFPLGHSRHIAFVSFLKVLRADIDFSAKTVQLFQFLVGKRAQPSVHLNEPVLRTGTNILLIEDCLPDPGLGSGYPRTFSLITALAQLGNRVTVLPVLQREGRGRVQTNLRELGVGFFELEGHGEELPVDTILSSWKGEYQAVIICRPHNMKLFGRIVRKANPDTVLVYDAEALYANRTISHAFVLSGEPLPPKRQSHLVQKELRLARFADCVLTVSANEKAQFTSIVNVPVGVVAHACVCGLTGKSFVDRKGILFVGGILAVPGPNENAVRFLVQDVFPIIRSLCEIPVTVVGSGCVANAFPKAEKGITFAGPQQDLRPFYESHRVFIAPTRYSAGIPLKVIESVSQGLPCVVSGHLHERLGWNAGVEYLTGASPSELAEKCVLLHSDNLLWESVRSAGAEKIQRDFSPKALVANLTQVLKAAGLPI